MLLTTSGVVNTGLLLLHGRFAFRTAKEAGNVRSLLAERTRRAAEDALRGLWRLGLMTSAVVKSRVPWGDALCSPCVIAASGHEAVACVRRAMPACDHVWCNHQRVAK